MAFSYYFCLMKYSQAIGILLSLLLIYSTTQPLVIIDSKHWVITGWETGASSFGQPGKFLVYFAILNILCFALPYIFAKRTNIIIAALILAWSIRNYLILSTCYMGECPQKQWALYACIALSAGILIMTFLPKINIDKK